MIHTNAEFEVGYACFLVFTFCVYILHGSGQRKPMRDKTTSRQDEVKVITLCTVCVNNYYFLSCHSVDIISTVKRPNDNDTLMYNKIKVLIEFGEKFMNYTF